MGKCSKLKKTKGTWQLGDMVLKDTEERRERGGKEGRKEKIPIKDIWGQTGETLMQSVFDYPFDAKFLASEHYEGE